MKNKNGNWLFILALCALVLGVCALICAIIAEIEELDTFFKTSVIILAVAGPASIVMFILRAIFYPNSLKEEPKTPKVKTYKYNDKDIPTVDVKEIKKSQDEIMYDKYVDLYNKKIITKEDLDKKREELLGK